MLRSDTMIVLLPLMRRTLIGRVEMTSGCNGNWVLLKDVDWLKKRRRRKESSMRLLRVGRKSVCKRSPKMFPKWSYSRYELRIARELGFNFGRLKLPE